MNIKYSRITNEMLEKINKEEAYIYYLMNNGYSYQNKIIKSDNVSDYEYAIIAENLDKISGVNIKLDFKREYLYSDTFRSILGRIGEITYEKGSSLIDGDVAPVRFKCQRYRCVPYQ